MEGQIGVWLTSATEPHGHGLLGSRFNKKAFRVEVQLDENALLCRWPEWSLRNVTTETRRILNGAAAEEIGQDLTHTWWIYFGWIRPRQIVRVTEMASGEEVENWATFWPEHLIVPAVSFRRKMIWQKKMLKEVRRALAQKRP
ncbi:hypothetical protein ACFSX5_04670 [Devosia albogilva]|uniref:Polyketide cyclase n=1 Tax=Devosia albogilva TaxID=429726 RepID=A0ABW5QHK2_9HYPH